MAIITVSRQYASGGDEIAARVCDQLGYRYFDKQLMFQVAADMGLCEEGTLDLSEDKFEVRHFLTRLFQAGPRVLVWGTDEAGKYTLTDQQLDAGRCIDIIRRTMLAIYDEGNTVIVGRAGQVVLRDKPGVLHLRVVAPLADRIKRLQQQGVRGIAEIKLILAQRDKATAQYFKRFYNINWDDPTHYHLVINTGMMDIEAAAALVVSAVHQMEGRAATVT